MDQNFCKCPTAKTQKYISDNGNICPTCNLTLAENNDDLVTLLRGLTMGNVSGATRSANAQGVRLKPPTFDGSGDSKHFFVKLSNYMETYGISSNGEIIRLLKSCLESAALDLYLSLSLAEQSDLEELGQIFQNHFRPLSHRIVETENFLKIKKKPSESISEFYAALKKKASELEIDKSLLEITFIAGIEKETQKHCILQKAETLEDYLKEALEFEKVTKIGNSQPKLAMSTSKEGKTQDRDQSKLDAVLELLINQSQAQNYQNGNEDNNAGWGNRVNNVNANQGAYNTNHDNNANYGDKHSTANYGDDNSGNIVAI